MDRAERAAAAPPTVEPDPGNAGEGKVIQLPRSTRYDAVVIGAGLIGLACAWRAAKRGLSVLVVDRAETPAAGSSGVAAGMLAPVTEADFGEEGPLRVNLLARERWPAFAAELEEVTGLPTGYRDSGALVVAADRDDAEELYGDYQLVVDAIGERLYDIREAYAGTLDEDAADEYRGAFDTVARKRFRRFSAFLEDEA